MDLYVAHTSYVILCGLVCSAYIIHYSMWTCMQHKMHVTEKKIWKSLRLWIYESGSYDGYAYRLSSNQRISHSHSKMYMCTTHHHLLYFCMNHTQIRSCPMVLKRPDNNTSLALLVYHHVCQYVKHMNFLQVWWWFYTNTRLLSSSAARVSDSLGWTDWSAWDGSWSSILLTVLLLHKVSAWMVPWHTYVVFHHQMGFENYPQHHFVCPNQIL